ncbi:DUF2975 domain-containing protein [Oscillospiraceae bacterium MB08-C2-2]|nr:DUF2975 domain-containing protein [Oscillospiraceae bacterium MB08-C2-2]
MKKSVASKALAAAICTVFAIGLFLVVTLPFLLDTYLLILYDAYSVQPGYRTFILSFLMVVGVLALWMLAEMLGMLRTIPADPFIAKNVRTLRRIGIVAILTAALFFGKCLYYFTILTLGCGVILLVGGLFAFTLSDLFNQAVIFKQENDLTI